MTDERLTIGSAERLYRAYAEIVVAGVTRTKVGRNTYVGETVELGHEMINYDKERPFSVLMLAERCNIHEDAVRSAVNGYLRGILNSGARSV